MAVAPADAPSAACMDIVGCVSGRGVTATPQATALEMAEWDKMGTGTGVFEVFPSILQSFPPSTICFT